MAPFRVRSRPEPTGRLDGGIPLATRRFHWASVLALTLLTVGLAMAAYFFFRVQAQENYYEGRNFRLLRSLGRQLAEQTEALGQVMDFVTVPDPALRAARDKVDEFSRQHLFAEQKVKALSAHGPATNSEVLAAAKERLDYLEEQLSEANRALKEVDSTGTGSRKHRAARSADPPTLDIEESAVHAVQRVPGFAGLKIELSTEPLPCNAIPSTDKASFCLSWEDRWVVHAALGPRFDKDGNPCTRPPRPAVRAKVPVASLVDAQAASSVFREVLIAREDGLVVDRRGSLDSGIQHVSALLDAIEPGTREAREDGKDSDADQRSEPRRQVPRHALVGRSEIAGTAHVIFVQPVPAPFAVYHAEEPTTVQAKANVSMTEFWYVIGISPEREFRAEVAAVPVGALTLLGVSIALCLLAYPLLKLWLSGTDEAVGLGQVLFTSLALVAGFGLLTALVLEASVLAERTYRRDAVLEEISNRLHHSLSVELGRLRRELARQAEAIRAARERGESTKDGYLPLKPGERAAFELAFALSKEGHQVGFIPRHRAQPIAECFPAGERLYFTRIRDGQPTGFPPDGEKAGPIGRAFVLDRVRARDQGALLYVLSAPYTEKVRLEGLAAAVIVGDVRSLSETVMPPEFGFVVIEGTGRTLHHSNQDQRSLVENFFEETDRHQQLRSLVRTRDSTPVSARYYGHPHRFLARHIEHTDLTLVVYHEERAAQAAHLELLLLTCFVLACHLVLVGAALWLAAKLWPVRGGWSWTWPNPRQRLAYLLLAVLLLLLLVSSILGLSNLARSSSPLRIPAIVLAQSAAAVACVALALSPRSFGGWRDGLFAACATIPAGLCVYLVHRSEITSPWTERLWLGSLILLAGMAVLPSLLRRAGAEIPVDTFPRRWRAVYVGVGVLLVALLGGLPVVAIHQDGLLLQRTRAARTKAIRLAQGVFGLEQRARAEAFRIDPIANAFGEQGISAIDLARWNLTVGEAWLLGGPTPSGTAPAGVHAPEPVPRIQGRFTARFARLVPSLYPQLAEARHLVDARTGSSWPAGDRGWSIQVDGRADTVDVPIPAAPVPGGVPTWQMLVAAALPMWIAFPLLRATSRRLLALAVPEGESRVWDPSKISWHTRNHLLLGPRVASLSQLKQEIAAHWKGSQNADITVVSLQDPAQPSETLRRLLENEPPNGPEVLVVGPVDYVLTERQRRVQLLQLVELAQAESVLLVVRSDVSPLVAFDLSGDSPVEPAHDASTSRANLAACGTPPLTSEQERGRWARALASFAVLEYPATGELQIGASANPGRRRLRLECGWRPELAAVEEALESKAAELTEAQVIEEVGIRAEPFFRHLWDTCRLEERLLILHLAQGRWINARRPSTLRSLERRGIVGRDPALRLSSQAFGRFARVAEPAHRVQGWEQQAKESAWALIRIPIVVAILALTGLVIYSGRNIVREGMDALPLLIAAVPALLALLNSLRPGGPGETATR